MKDFSSATLVPCLPRWQGTHRNDTVWMPVQQNGSSDKSLKKEALGKTPVLFGELHFPLPAAPWRNTKGEWPWVKDPWCCSLSCRRPHGTCFFKSHSLKDGSNPNLPHTVGQRITRKYSSPPCRWKILTRHSSFHVGSLPWASPHVLAV